MAVDRERLRLVPYPTKERFSVRVPGVLSEVVEKRIVIIDEHEIDTLETLGRRLEELGAYTNGGLISRLVERWKLGPRA